MQYSRGFLLSLVLHAIVLVLLVVGLSTVAPQPIVRRGTKIIKATAIDANQVNAEMRRLEQQQAQKRRAEEAHRRYLEQQREQRLRQQRLAREQHLAKLRAERQQQQRLAAEKAQRAAKAEQALSRSQQALKAKKQREAIAKAKVEAARRAQALQGVVNRYQALILQDMARHWLLPPGVDKKLSCLLHIRLAKDGTVLEVTLLRSSGNVQLDRSARAAIFKASPLPVPQDPQAFKPFESFNLEAKPEGLLQNA